MSSEDEELFFVKEERVKIRMGNDPKCALEKAQYAAQPYLGLCNAAMKESKYLANDTHPNLQSIAERNIHVIIQVVNLRETMHSINAPRSPFPHTGRAKYAVKVTVDISLAESMN